MQYKVIRVRGVEGFWQILETLRGANGADIFMAQEVNVHVDKRISQTDELEIKFMSIIPSQIECIINTN